MNVVINVCRFIANQLALLTLLGAVTAYVYPSLFLVFKSSFLLFFAATMFAMGVVLDRMNCSRHYVQPLANRPGRHDAIYGDAVYWIC